MTDSSPVGVEHPPETLTDETLVTLARGGDAAAFAQLVGRHYDLVYRIAYKWLGHAGDAEDLAQDVSIKLATAIKSFEGRSAFTSWLYRLTLNMVRDLQRSQQRKAKNLSAVALVSEDRAAPEVDKTLEANDLWHAVSELPLKQREAVLLVYSEELTHREAAEVMGCAEGTVASNISDAKKALKYKLDETQVMVP